MKKKVNGCAVIEVAAGSVKMGVYQTGKTQLTCLDKLEYPLGVGHEIFQSGNMEYGTLSELTNIIHKFKTACYSFGIEDIRLISTSVMREALNSDIISDRISVKNKLDLEILSDGHEKSLIYFDIIKRLKESENTYNNVIIAYIGSGSIGIAKYDSECITHSFHIPLGAVKFNDILSGFQNKMPDYHSVIEEYLHPLFSRINLDKCDCMILTGVGMDNVLSFVDCSMENDLYMLSTLEIRRLHHEISPLTTENVSRLYNMTESDSSMFSTSLCIAYELLRTIGKDTKLSIAEIEMDKIIAKHQLIPSVETEYSKHIYESSIKVATIKAEKYNCNPVHYNSVRSISSLLFDKLKKVHGLDDKYKKTLEIASILHSCGQFVNTRARTNCSFDLIKNLHLYGVSRAETLLIAFVAASNEFVAPDNSNLNLKLFGQGREMLIKKLAAIFRLANALDKSQKAKISIKSVKIEESKMLIRAVSIEPALIEEWAFSQCADYFTQVFGIEPIITIKSQLL